MAKPLFRIDNVARCLRCESEIPQVAAALSRSYRRAYEVVEPPGSTTPYHAHPQEETVIVVEGAMRFNVEEKLVLVGEGRMIVIRERAIHACASVGERPARLVVALSSDRRPASETGSAAEDDFAGEE